MDDVPPTGSRPRVRPSSPAPDAGTPPFRWPLRRPPRSRSGRPAGTADQAW